MHRSKYRIGVTALGLSFLALLLSVIPFCLLEKKRAVLEQHCNDETATYSFIYEGQGMSCQSEAKKCAEELRCLARRLWFCNLAMTLTALAAIGTALYSAWKERVKELYLFSIVSSLVVLSLQHVGAGLSVSIALLVFTMLAACG
jgi:hypothetical protein